MADVPHVLRSTLTGVAALSHITAKNAEPPIAALTRRLAAGDEAAFREFHTRYFDRLYHFLLVVTRGQEHAAREAVQETLLRVVRHAREFEREEVFWGWLKAIGRNAARDGGRKQRRYLSVLERFRFWDPEPTPVPAGEDDRLRDLIEDSLAELDPTSRGLLEGKYLRGATVIELAAATGLTEKAVESRLARLRRELAVRLLKKLRAP